MKPIGQHSIARQRRRFHASECETSEATPSSNGMSRWESDCRGTREPLARFLAISDDRKSAVHPGHESRR
jgi:hypothetical protein